MRENGCCSGCAYLLALSAVCCFLAMLLMVIP